MYFHSQNLKKEDGEKGLVHWRCWLGNRPGLAFSISIPSRFWHIHLDIATGEDALGFSIATPLCAIWLSLEHYPLQRFLSKLVDGKRGYGGRVIGISFHDSTFWVKLWEDPMGWSSTDPKWWSFTIKPLQIIFGKEKYSEVVKDEGEMLIDMPEGKYEATYKRFTSYWKRERAWWTKSIERIEVEIPVGIPHEGKGENSWDMGMDATFGTTRPCNHRKPIWVIAKQIALDALKDRQKYGGLSDPGYAKWKEEGEKKYAERKRLANANGMPVNMVPRMGELKERE